MLKKLLVLVGVLLVGGWLWAKSDLGSYARTAFRQVKGVAKKQVPVDFEIRRAEDKLNSLGDVDRRLVKTQATLTSEVRWLEKEVNELQARVESDKSKLLATNQTLQAGSTLITNTGREITSRSEQMGELNRMFSNFKLLENALKSKKALLDEQRKRLEAVQKQRDELKLTRDDLMARISNLKTQQEALRAAEIRSRVTVEDSQLPELAQIKELIEGLEKRIDANMVELEIRQAEQQPITTPRQIINPHLTKEIDSYFGIGSKDGQVIVGK
jgi:chromosome segregation ATPase